VRAASLVVVITLAGCQGYRAGSFAGPRGAFKGEQRTVGCLDIAVTPTHALDAYGPVVGLTIANRCDVGVVVDVGAIRATGRDPGGSEIRLGAYDPAFEIRPAMLEARSVATEHLELLRMDRNEALFTQWCVDLAKLDRERPSDRPVVVCFANGVRT